MKRKKILILFILTIVITPILISGCVGLSPTTKPNEEYTEENTVLDYIKVIPGNAEIKFNQSQKFEVKAYNSDNKPIQIDVTKLKWTCSYQCIGCGVVCNVAPIYNSTQTTFKATNPKKTGRFEVWVNYGGVNGKWAKAVVNVN
jgi:hypothetical protein